MSLTPESKPERLSPEREADIRKYWEGTGEDRDELLAEIDELRAQNANIKRDLESPIVRERDLLKSLLKDIIYVRIFI
jgi:hypothetical protein